MEQKQTSLTDVESLMSELFTKLKNNNLSKKEHTDIVKKLKYLEAHYRNVQDKKTNGKKYPPVDKGYFSETSGLNDKEKKEALKLIDSGNTSEEQDEYRKQFNLEYWSHYINEQDIDLSGVSVGVDRFIFKEKG